MLHGINDLRGINSQAEHSLMIGCCLNENLIRALYWRRMSFFTKGTNTMLITFKSSASSLSDLTDRSEGKSVLRQFLSSFAANSGSI
jgi:hypothetical protein